MSEIEEIKSALRGLDNSVKESGLDPREVSQLLDSLSSIAKSLSDVSCASVQAEEDGATPFEYIGHQLCILDSTIRSGSELIAEAILKQGTGEPVYVPT